MTATETPLAETIAQTLTGRSMIFSGGIGVATPKAKTAAQAIVEGGLDWNVSLKQAGYNDEMTGWHPADRGSRAVVREDTGQVFGFVKSRYTAIQNHEMFDWCDRLVDDYGAKYEAAWCLYGGSEVGLTMRFPENILIGGIDPVGTYLLLRARHDGTGSVIAHRIGVRLFCTNMLNMAVKGAVNKVRIPHLTNATSKLAAARETFDMTFKFDAAFEAEMNALLEKETSDKRFKDIMSRVLPEQRFGGVERHVNTMIELRKTSPTIQDEIRGSAYGALQAVTEWTDWVREAKSSQGRVVDMLDGRVLRLKTATTAALSR